MTANFERIPDSEQERILKIILEEFAEFGYERASTNTIVQNAGIPKGTLFYYFGSKKAMFLYAVDEAVKRFTSIYQSLAGNSPKDLFEGLLYRMKIKLQFVHKEPLLYNFFYKAFLDIPEELKEDMTARFAAYATASQDAAHKNLDKTKLREGVDADAALKMIYLMLEGLLNRITPQLKLMSPDEGLQMVEKFEEECRQYFNFVRQGIYR